MENRKIRWGILGTGNIANKMADALKSLEDAELAAVGSRTKEKAEAFGEKHGIPRRHGSYQALADDPEVDIIYVCTPHTLHAENTLLCLDRGKAVLCEKPFTVNAAQARATVAKAREKGLFLMEAMWTRFLPAMRKCREIVRSGRIGEVRMLQADFGFRAGWDPQGRLLNPELAGGGLLDVGVYCVSLAYFLLGAPSRLESLAHIGETGVDEQNALLLGYPGGEIAILSSAVRTNTPHVAFVMGTEGMIRIPAFWCARELTVISGGQEERIEAEYSGNGFEFQAMEAMRCLREGLTESETIPLDESIAIMETMDRAREQWGLKYPGE
jgi:predicted dehydrogenase